MVGNAMSCSLRTGEWDWAAALLDEWLSNEITGSFYLELYVDRAVLTALRGGDPPRTSPRPTAGGRLHGRSPVPLVRPLGPGLGGPRRRSARRGARRRPRVAPTLTELLRPISPAARGPRRPVGRRRGGGRGHRRPARELAHPGPGGRHSTSRPCEPGWQPWRAPRRGDRRVSRGAPRLARARAGLDEAHGGPRHGDPARPDRARDGRGARGRGRVGPRDPDPARGDAAAGPPGCGGVGCLRRAGVGLGRPFSAVWPRRSARSDGGRSLSTAEWGIRGRGCRSIRIEAQRGVLADPSDPNHRTRVRASHRYVPEWRASSMSRLLGASLLSIVLIAGCGSAATSPGGAPRLGPQPRRPRRPRRRNPFALACTDAHARTRWRSWPGSRSGPSPRRRSVGWSASPTGTWPSTRP